MAKDSYGQKEEKTHAFVKLMKPGKFIEIWYISLPPIRDVDFVVKLRYV